MVNPRPHGAIAMRIRLGNGNQKHIHTATFSEHAGIKMEKARQIFRSALRNCPSCTAAQKIAEKAQMLFHPLCDMRLLLSEGKHKEHIHICKGIRIACQCIHQRIRLGANVRDGDGIAGANLPHSLIRRQKPAGKTVFPIHLLHPFFFIRVHQITNLS